ncbi:MULTISPECIES: hypothetical protein [Streptomyces]|uniref:Transposase n=2 Tax=Streptomyces TaxID=1883 RepID=A0ABV9IZD6_9ACTN
MDLDAVARELYALRPEDFTTARDAREAAARSDGDRALAQKIRKLRRPSLSAWASNLLVRERPDETRTLLRLGEALRQAHHDLDGPQLRELSRQQHVLIEALSQQARQLAVSAGHPISDNAQHEVESTLHAVLADPRAAEEWATGRLVKPFGQTIGFPASDDAVPRRAAGPARSAPSRSPLRGGRNGKAERVDRRTERARQAAADAEKALGALLSDAAVAGREADNAEQHEKDLHERVGELADELNRLEGEHEQARTAAHQARERQQAADRQVRAARRRVATATARLSGSTRRRP